MFFWFLIGFFSNLVENCTIKPGYRSDNSFVLLEFKFYPFQRGRGLSKFQNNRLTDKEYVSNVRETIHRVNR